MDRRYICWLSRQGVVALKKEKEQITYEELPRVRQLIVSEPELERRYQVIKQVFLKRILRINQMLHYNQNVSANEQLTDQQVRDLIGQTGSTTKRIKVIDAKKGKHGVDVRVSDNMGETYWTGLEDIDLDE
ncbi:hypothetical protein [Paenibacillus sp. NPDC055715]